MNASFYYQQSNEYSNRMLIIRLALRSFFISILCSISGLAFSQEVTGKIVIDGVVYGGSENNQISKGSGEFGREKRASVEFQQVIVLGGVDVVYKKASETSIEVSGDQNLLKLITTKVNQGVLTIGSKKNYQTRIPLKVELTGPHLTAFNMRGAGDIVLKGINESSLRLDLNGSGDVTVDGQVGSVAITITGASDVHAKGLKSERADIKLAGSGDIDITVTKALKGNILGSGDITYYGGPESIDKHVVGSGDIEPGY